MAQFARPISDVAAGSWDDSAVGDNDGAHWDELVTDDGSLTESDAVGNNTNTTNLDVELTNSGLDDPVGNVTHVIRTRWLHDQSGRSMQGNCELWQGVPGTGTLIATLQVDPDVGTTEATGAYTLTGTEADNITDYNDLHFRLWGRGTGGGPNRQLNVDLAEFEFPDAPAGQTIAVGVLAETNPLVTVDPVKVAPVGTLAEIDTPLGGGIRDDWTGTNGDPWDPIVWDVLTPAGSPVVDIQSNRGRMAVSSAADQAQAGSDRSLVTSIDLTFRFIRSVGGNNTNVCIGNGQWAGDEEETDTGYCFNDSGTTFRVFEYAAGSFVGTLGTWAYDGDQLDALVRFQREGTAVRCKTWTPGTPEPDAWDLDVTDASFTGPYFVQITAFGANVSSFNLDIDDLGARAIGEGVTFATKVANIGTLAESESLIPAAVEQGGGQNVAVGVLLEQDSLIAIAGGKVAPVGVLSETDSLVAIGGIKTAPVGVLAETDSLIAIAAGKVAPIGVLAESDSLVPIEALKEIVTAVGVLLEQDSLISVQPRKIGNVGTLAELESLIAIEALKPIVTTVGTLGELEVLISVQPIKLANIGTLAGFDSLIAIQAIKVAAVGTLGETDSLIVIAVVQPAVPVGVLGETNLLVAIQAIKIGTVGTLLEQDSLVPIEALKPIITAVGVLAESDLLVAIEALKPIITPVGVLAEIDSLIPIEAIQAAIDVGTLAELEALIPVQAFKTAQIGTLAESDVLVAISAVKVAVLGTLGEIGSLVSVQALKVALIGTLAELEALLPIAAEKEIVTPVGVLAELEPLIPVSPIKVAPVGTIGEVELLVAIAAVRFVAVGTLSEIDTLIAILLITTGGFFWEKDTTPFTKDPAAFTKTAVSFTKRKPGDP